MADTLFSNAILTIGAMFLLWGLSVLRKDASIIDPFWGIGFVFIVWNSWRLSEPEHQSFLVPTLTTIWGLRLSFHLAVRNLGHDEDFRYRAMREKHGKRFWLVSLCTVFGLQGLIMWFVALPLQFSFRQTEANSVGAIAGSVFWLVGILFESIGDWQLAQFRSKPKNQGKILDTGLWRFTRHPNYFGDFCVWWGLYVVAVAGGAPIWTVASPIVMSILLLRVSGVTLLEKSLKNSKSGYSGYASRTNSFFPWLPRRTSKLEES